MLKKSERSGEIEKVKMRIEKCKMKGCGNEVRYRQVECAKAARSSSLNVDYGSGHLNSTPILHFSILIFHFSF